MQQYNFCSHADSDLKLEAYYLKENPTRYASCLLISCKFAIKVDFSYHDVVEVTRLYSTKMEICDLVSFKPTGKRC